MPKLLNSAPQKLRHFLVAASALMLVACATATPYQAASKPGAYDGFSQQLIENDRARVSFGGNSLTDKETVENYLLYRSAELAVENGYETFTLQERDVEEKRNLRVSPGANSGFGFGPGFRSDPFFRYSFFRPSFGWSRDYRFSRFAGFNRGIGFGRRGFGRSGFRGGGFNDPFFNNYNAREITKYRATAEVKFGNNTFSEDPRTFNAREVLDNLSSTITLPEQDES